ncbi:hypothetical protein [Halobacillus salinus]|uniref:hypothetical protein n=1 Tax=Halobacillus salinus TaxID=192814 RepID=UPI0009A90A73|nr:hypothetical protein [Halobacillus salinus]
MGKIVVNALMIFAGSIVLLFLIAGNTGEQPVYSTSIVMILLLSFAVSLLIKIVQSGHLRH